MQAVRYETTLSKPIRIASNKKRGAFMGLFLRLRVF
jgi:hypothetical protein